MTETTTLMLEDHVPNFTMDIYDPQEDAIISKTIQDYQGKRLILFFYPADFTFVCPTELKDMGKAYPSIQAANAEMLVVSTDTTFSHKRRVETESLLANFNIKMVSDRTTHISKLFGCYNKQSGNSERGTFIISPDGVIKSIEIVTEPIGRSSNELVRKINALNYVATHPGHACPASWNLG
jgi:alkyl hydroperoxide reductase subunit AhpC